MTFLWPWIRQWSVLRSLTPQSTRRRNRLLSHLSRAAETLEFRTLLAGTAAETYAWAIVNEMRDNPALFALELEAMFFQTTAAAHGYAAGDPVWTDLRESIVATTQNQANFQAAIDLMRQQPRLGPLAWDDGLDAESDFHNQWMKDNCFGHSQFPGQPVPPCAGTLPNTNGDGNNMPADVVNLPAGFVAWSENIGFFAGFSHTLQAFLNGQIDKNGYEQRMAYRSTVAYILEIGSANLGHIRSLLARDNLTGSTDGFARLNAIGIGLDFYGPSQSVGGEIVFENIVSTHTLSRRNVNTGGYVAGLGYEDLNGNGRYDIGEGVTSNWNLAQAFGPTNINFATTNASHGLITQLVPADGEYHLTALPGTQTIGPRGLNVNSRNVWAPYRFSGSFGLTDGGDPFTLPDRYEPNDNINQSFDLGAFGPEFRSKPTDGLSLHVPGDADWFRFQLIDFPNANDRILIGFDHEMGNIDVRIWQQSAGGAFIPIISADSVNDNEVIDLSGLGAGMYYMDVRSPSASVNFYSMTIDVNRVTTPPLPSVVALDGSTGNWDRFTSTGDSFTQSTGAMWSPSGWEYTATGDVNGDGQPDIIAFNSLNSTWWVGLYQPATNTYATSLWADWSDAGWEWFASGDFTGDGVIDVLAFNSIGATWWLGVSTGAGFSPLLWADWSDAGWTHFQSGDFNADGRSDFAAFNTLNGTWWVGLSQPVGPSTALWASGWSATNWEHLTAGDVTGDGRADIVGFNTLNGTWWVAVSTGSGFSTQLWAQGWSTFGWRDVIIADWTGDGVNDVAIFNTVNSTWWVMTSFGNSFGTSLWSNLSSQGLGSNWTAPVHADFDGDGHLDLAVYNANLDRWYMQLSTGSGFLNAADWAALPNSYNPLAAHAVT